MIDELRRPLGQTIRRAAPRPARRVLARLCGGVAVALVLAGSAATAWLQPAFPHVDVFAAAAARAEAERIAASAATPPQLAPLRPLGPEAVIRGAPLSDRDEPDATLPTITYPPSYTEASGRTLSVRDPGSLRQPAASSHLPDEALIEPGPEGPMPVRGADGRRPFDVYAGEPGVGLGTRIAIVVGGLGISQTGTQNAIARLPPAVTLGFAPAGNSLDRWMQAARRDGHELMLQVPMEPVGYPDVSPGPHTVTAREASGRDFSELDWSMSRLTNYVGVMNYMGARVSSDSAAIRAVLSELSRRGLMYLDDGSSGRSLAKGAAREAGAVFANADVTLDADQSPQAIIAQLDTLERAARAGGTAIGVASAFPASVETIAAWIVEAEKRGLRVVPVSALAVDPEAR